MSIEEDNDDELMRLLEDAENDPNLSISSPPPEAAIPAAALSLAAAAPPQNQEVSTNPPQPPPLKPNGFSSALNKPSELDKRLKDLDSSDDEDISNFLERKYNEYGQDIKTMLKKQSDEKCDRKISREVNDCLRNEVTTKQISKTTPTPSPSPAPSLASQSNSNVGIYTDPIFGLRIIHPLISSTVMQERMSNRKAITVSNLRQHILHGDVSKDWAVAGVIISKTPLAKSKKGHQYACWKLSDLKNDMKPFSLLLFGTACKDLWKTGEGMVVAVLNPTVLDKDKLTTGASISDISLSVDTSKKFMILGQSKDLGVCKSRKKNGDPCQAIVNKHLCEYCVYHVQQEYNRISVRTELQSATSGRGLNSLRNKVLGKCEVFYGGQSFVAVPAKKNAKLIAKDQNRLETLSQFYQRPATSANISAGGVGRGGNAHKATSKIAPTIDKNVHQRQKDLDRLKQLSADTSSSSSSSSASQKTTVSSIPASTISTTTGGGGITAEQFRTKQFSLQQQPPPKLKSEGFSFETVSSLRKSEAAKSKAAEILKKTPIPKSNPNFIRHRGSGSVTGENVARKRALETSLENNGNSENAIKKQKITDEAEKFRKERIQQIINAKSSHTELIEASEQQAQENYFNKLEKKEAMEEKMLNTFKVACKAVVCLKCRYTAFSASDRCKEERHPLKVIDAEKRFFECADCSARTVTVHRMPQTTCKNCQSSRWKRTAMIKNRNIERVGEHLSIRGDEETFLGSVHNKGNLNLCVATEE